MAIKRKRPTDLKLSAVKEFTDRVEPRKAFWNRYAKMAAEGSTIISFYGAGGVGKTTLLKKLEDEIKNRDALTNKKCVYVKYDLNISTDLREILKTFKFQLTNYGCNFPLFDTGNYYYSLKTGQDITPPKAKFMMEKISWFNEIKQSLSNASQVAMPTASALDATKIFFDMTEEALQAIPATKVVIMCFSVVNTLLAEYMARNKILDDDHEELRYRLNAHFQEKNPVALYEYLPTLFAMDVADWIKKTGNKLVVMLDNYEMLIRETNLATEEQLKRDLWLRGDEGLIFGIPDTLWTISGRNKLRWDDELADELEQHLIKALSPEDSNWFLKRAGIENETLRGELVKLTEGYPIFLDLCVDVYVKYMGLYGTEPTIEEFGQKREEVVARIFRYLDADRDDAAKDMLEFLCVLNVWTDELAIDIGGQALHNFSRNTYKRVKEFSFIQKERIENEDLDLTIYRFDKTIQSILIATCDRKLIDDATAAANDYFQKYFASSAAVYAKFIFYLKLWAEFIVRFATDSDSLKEQYANTLGSYVSTLIDLAEFATAEEILNLFMDKIENFGDKDSVPYANLEVELGRLRLAQGKYSAAYEITNSAYEKLSRLLGDEHSNTLLAMNNLAVTLSNLGRYDEALILQETVLTLRKKIFGDKHPNTLVAVDNLAGSLRDLGRYNEALKLQEKVSALRKENFGEEHPDTLLAMNNLAVTLSNLGRYDEALILQEKVLTLRKKILGEEHPDTLLSMNNLAFTLRELGRYDEALELQENVLAFYKEIFGEEHPDTLMVMNNLALTLRDLGRYDEASELQETVLALSKENFGEEHPATLRAMNNLAFTLRDMGYYDKALISQEKILALSKKILGNEHPYTLSSMNNLALTLRDLGRYDEALELQEKVLALSKKIFGENHPATLQATNNLAVISRDMGRYDEASELQEKVLALSKEIFGAEHPTTLGAMNNLANTLNDLGRYDEALELQEKILALSKEILGENHPNTIMSMNNSAVMLNKLGRYDEALKLQEKILVLSKKILGENHPVTLRAMNNLAGTLSGLERYDETLALQEKVLALSKEILGENHPDTLLAMNNLADTLSELKRYDEALSLQRDTLARCKNNLGENHPWNIVALQNLLKITYDSGARDEAIQVMEDVLTKMKEILGNEHTDTQKFIKLREKILNDTV